MAFLMDIDSGLFVPDPAARLVAGDLPCLKAYHMGRNVLQFDDQDEMAAIMGGFLECPAFTTSLTARLRLYPDASPTSNFRFEIYVFSVTPGTPTSGDTIDLRDTISFDSPNAASLDISAEAEGDPLRLDITLSNNDSIAEGDFFLLGLRRDADHADDANTVLAFFDGLSLHDAA